MSPIWLGPSAVAPATVRRLSADGSQEGARLQRLAVPEVPAAHAVPRQLDPVEVRLVALQLENDELRAELEQLRPSR